MSLCDLVEDGKWYWAHSGEDLGAFAQWDTSEPNDVGKVPQRCVEIRYTHKNGKLTQQIICIYVKLFIWGTKALDLEKT
jgi:hypothetical protein